MDTIFITIERWHLEEFTALDELWNQWLIFHTSRYLLERINLVQKEYFCHFFSKYDA